MTIAVFGRTELRCSVFVLLLFPAAVVFDKLDTLLIAAASVITHELAHAFMAHRLGFSAASIELQPFGCVARLTREPDSPSEAAAIAAAGPLISLLLSLMAAGLAFFSGAGGFGAASQAGAKGGALSEFAFFNLTLGVVNLLPVLPLDGGRLALAAVSAASGKRRRRAARALSFLGVLIGIIIAASGVYAIIKSSAGLALVRAVSLMITGGFICLSAAAEGLNAASNEAKTRLSTASRLRSRGGTRIFAAALHKSRTVRDALMAVSGSCYGVVYVVDDDMRTIGILDEGTLMNEAVRGGSGTRLGEIMKNDGAVPFNK